MAKKTATHFPTAPLAQVLRKCGAGAARNDAGDAQPPRGPAALPKKPARATRRGY